MCGGANTPSNTRPPEKHGPSRSVPDSAPRSLFLNNNNLSGTLPAEWGKDGSFPSLELLFLGDNGFTGEERRVAAEGGWGWPRAGRSDLGARWSLV